MHEGVFPEMTDRGKTTYHECWGHHPTDGILLETQTEKGEKKLSGNFLLSLLPILMEGEKQLPSMQTEADSTPELWFHPSFPCWFTTTHNHTARAVPSSGLLWHQAPTWHTDMHVAKTPTQKVKWINLIKILKSNVHSKHMRPRENNVSQNSDYIKVAISDEKDTAKWGQEDWGAQGMKYNEGN